MRRRRAGPWLAAALLLGCSGTTDPEVCGDAEDAFGGNVCLVLGASGAFEPHRSVIESEVEATLAAVRTRLAVTDLQIGFFANLSSIIPEVGIGGFTPSAHEVRIYLDPDDSELEAIVRAHLLRILSHEIHHAVRRGAVGYGSSLLQAAISEGLADHFSLEVGAGDPAPWSVALTEAQLDEWVPQVVEQTTPGYDHARWFFGTTSAVPRWTGYAVGFHLVGAYLEAHPGSSASALVGEPATSFR